MAAEQDLVPVNYQIPRFLRDELKVYCAERKVKMGKVVADAILNILRSKKKESK